MCFSISFLGMSVMQIVITAELLACCMHYMSWIKDQSCAQDYFCTIVYSSAASALALIDAAIQCNHLC